jgi:NDP-sugar pyrophosphorylase family protein
MEPPTDTMLVLNGDILTQVDFQAMLAFHRAHEADLTIAVRRYDVQIPFGVVECEGEVVRHLTEKPMLNFFVNGGMYLMEPTVFQYLPAGERFDMPDLIQRLLQQNRLVVSFPVREYWLDIGRPADYEEAQAYAKSKKESL